MASFASCESSFHKYQRLLQHCVDAAVVEDEKEKMKPLTEFQVQALQKLSAARMVDFDNMDLVDRPWTREETREYATLCRLPVLIHASEYLELKQRALSCTLLEQQDQQRLRQLASERLEWMRVFEAVLPAVDDEIWSSMGIERAERTDANWIRIKLPLVFWQQPDASLVRDKQKRESAEAKLTPKQRLRKRLSRRDVQIGTKMRKLE